MLYPTTIVLLVSTLIHTKMPSARSKKNLRMCSKLIKSSLRTIVKGKAKPIPLQTGIVRTQLTEQTGQRIDGIMRAQYDAAKLTNSLLTPVVKGI